MLSLFDQLPAETRNEISQKARGIGVTGKGNDRAENWADLERDLKAAPAPVATPPLTPAEFEAILVASRGPSAKLPEISTELVSALAAFAAGNYGSAPTATGLLSSLIPDEDTRRLVNGLVNGLILNSKLAQQFSGAESFALLLPIFQLLGAENVVREVADAFAKANTIDGILSGDISALLSAIGMFGDLTPGQQALLKGTTMLVQNAGLSTPFKLSPVELGPPGVYVHGQHLATVESPTSCGAVLGPGPGSSNVLVYNLKAWRHGTDVHVCPLPSASTHGAAAFVVTYDKVLVNGAPVGRNADAYKETSATGAIAIGKTIRLVNPETGADWVPEMGQSSGIGLLDSAKEAVGNLANSTVEVAKDLLDPLSQGVDKLLDSLGYPKEANPDAPAAVGNCGPQFPFINNLILLTMSMGGVKVDCTPHELRYGDGRGGYEEQRKADNILDDWIATQFSDNPLAGAIARLLMRPGYNIVGTMAYPRTPERREMEAF